MTENNRILIADDNPANCELLQAYLEEVDCQIELAIDGQDTLDKVESFQPDLILLDVMMPRLNGFEVCKQLKEDPWNFIGERYPIGSVVRGKVVSMPDYGIFVELEEGIEGLPRLVAPDDSTATLDQRVRSYLHANCAHCHRKWGGGNAEFQLLAPLPLGETGTIDVKPGQGTFQLKEERLIAPGSPEQSLIYHRMNLLGLGRMPHIASSVRHEEAIQMVQQWIRQLTEKDIGAPTGFDRSE